MDRGDTKVGKGGEGRKREGREKARREGQEGKRRWGNMEGINIEKSQGWMENWEEK